jgi:hypothetical protein
LKKKMDFKGSEVEWMKESASRSPEYACPEKMGSLKGSSVEIISMISRREKFGSAFGEVTQGSQISGRGQR